MKSSVIPAPVGTYSGKAWIRPDLIVVAYSPDKEGLAQPIRLWSVRPKDGSLELLPISKDDPQCVLTQWQLPTTLADGRLGLVKACTPVDPNESLTFTILAYDLETDRVEPLGPVLDFLPRQFDWSPSLGRGIAAKSNGICATIAWLTLHELSYLTTVIDDDEGSFRLDEGYTDDNPRCSKGRADWPALSPDGQQVAFFASPRSVGVEGMARLSEPWNIYIMDAKGQQPRKTLEGVANPQGIRWSPDGDWLAFTGDAPDQGGGTWLYNTDTRRLVRVSEDGLGPPAWSPDGTKIAGLLKRGAGFPPQRQLVIIDVRPIVRGD